MEHPKENVFQKGWGNLEKNQGGMVDFDRIRMDFPGKTSPAAKAESKMLPVDKNTWLGITMFMGTNLNDPRKGDSEPCAQDPLE